MKHVFIQQVLALVLCSLVLSPLAQACAEHTEDGQAIHKVLSGINEQPLEPVETKPIVIVGDYALSDWVKGEDGGRALLRKTNGQWRIVGCGGDGFKNAKVLQMAGVPKHTAKQLIAELNEEEKELDPERVKQFGLFGNIGVSH